MITIRIRCGSCKDAHGSVAEVKDCYAQFAAWAAEAEAEIWAEAISSWCAGGGSYADAKIYAGVIASGQTWDEYLAKQDEAFAAEMEAAGLCEHQLSAALCCGAGHYPPDDPSDDWR